MENLLDTYNNTIQCLEKFLGAFQNEVLLKNSNLTTSFDLLQSRQRLDFKVSHIFPMFASISDNKSVIWSYFWYRCEELPLGNLLGIYNITVQCLEPFLIAFEKKVSLKKHTIAVLCKPASSEWSQFVVKLELVKLRFERLREIF